MTGKTTNKLVPNEPSRTITRKSALLYLLGGFLLAAVIVIPRDYIHSLEKAGMPYAGKHGAQLEFSANRVIGMYRQKRIMRGADPNGIWMRTVKDVQNIFYERAMKKLPTNEPVREDLWFVYFVSAEGMLDAHVDEFFQQLPQAYDVLLTQQSAYPAFEEDRYAIISGLLTLYRHKYSKWSLYKAFGSEKSTWINYHAQLANMMVEHYRALVDSTAFAKARPIVQFDFVEEAMLLLLSQANTVKQDCGNAQLFETLKTAYRASIEISATITPPDAMSRQLFDDSLVLNQNEAQPQMERLNAYLAEHCHFVLL